MRSHANYSDCTLTLCKCLTRVGNNSSATVNCNVILEEEVNYKGALSPSSKEEEENNIIKKYTEALRCGEWKVSFREYQEETSGVKTNKPDL